MELCLVYITAGSAEEARALCRALVEERLAACANVIGKIDSIYWWQGALAEDGEVGLFAKTRVSLLEPLTARVRELHSYSCPCVVALPILTGNPDYLNWLEEETAHADKGGTGAPA